MKPLPVKIPPLWLSLALILWGVATGPWLIALFMAVSLELPLLTRWKWNIDDREFYRVGDLSSVIFALVAIFQFNQYAMHGIYRILALLPFCLFPLVLVQRYSAAQTTPLGALFLRLRRKKSDEIKPGRSIDLAPAYVVVCLIAASTAVGFAQWYSLACAGLLIGLLVPAKPRRHKNTVWLFALVMVGMLSFAGQASVRQLHLLAEDAFVYWFDQFNWGVRDPDRNITAIGTIGRLKLSDRIRVRIRPEDPIALPLRLYEASYSTFNLGTWSAPDGNFEALDADVRSQGWLLSEQSAKTSRVIEITTAHRKEVGVIPLPPGSIWLGGKELVEIQRSNYGTIKAEAKPGPLRYRVRYTTNRIEAPPPRPDDLVVPENYRKVIAETASQWIVPGSTPAEKIQHIHAFFEENFRYSLIQKGFYPGRTPLAWFLKRTRKGHCEYFATASVLMLRNAGIPARYTVGYMVNEYSALEGAYVARARHAHSWAIAYVDDAWIVVDTTPSVWFSMEDALATGWQTVQDLWSWLSDRYQRLGRVENEDFSQQLLWAVPPLIALLIWRLRRYGKTTQKSAGHEGPIAVERGEDSALYRLTEILEKDDIHPHAGELITRFLNRHFGPEYGGIVLQQLLEFHYRYRFSNELLSSIEVARFTKDVNLYLRGYDTLSRNNDYPLKTQASRSENAGRGH